MLAHHDVSEFLFVPLIHGVLVLGIASSLCISRIRVQVPLGGLALDAKIVAELAFATLFTMALFEKLTHNGLGVDAKRHFLHLHRFEQLGSLALGLFGGGLFSLALGFLCFSFLFVGIFAAPALSLELCNLFLGCSSFFLSRVNILGCLFIGCCVFFFFSSQLWRGTRNVHFSYQRSTPHQSVKNRIHSHKTNAYLVIHRRLLLLRLVCSLLWRHLGRAALSQGSINLVFR